MSDAVPVAQAFFRYPGVAQTYEEALAKMKQDNPGYGERCYSLAVDAALVAMR